MTTPFGKVSCGAPVRDATWLAKSAYWNTISFSFDPPSTQLWFRLIELNVFALSPQLELMRRWFAPYTCELVFRP